MFVTRVFSVRFEGIVALLRIVTYLTVRRGCVIAYQWGQMARVRGVVDLGGSTSLNSPPPDTTAVCSFVESALSERYHFALSALTFY